jgi:hypothetical protein
MTKKKTLAEVGEEKRQEEMNKEFVNSFRGGYILGQALHVAIPILEAMEFPEHSNIADMKYLRDNLFPVYSGVHRAMEKHAVEENPPPRNIRKKIKDSEDESVGF